MHILSKHTLSAGEYCIEKDQGALTSADSGIFACARVSYELCLLLCLNSRLLEEGFINVTNNQGEECSESTMHMLL